MYDSGSPDIFNNAFFKGLWESSPDNMFIVMRERGVFFIYRVNPAQEKAVNLLDSEIRGRELSSVFDPSLYERFASNYSRCLEERNPIRYEESFLNHEGCYTYWETLLIPIFPENDDKEYIYGVCRDITPRREAEESLAFLKKEAERVDRVKLSFLANMSHEMRTPLNGISGAVSLFLGSDNAEERKDLARIINNSVESLSRITNDVLDYAKLNVGNLRLEMTNFNLLELLNDVLLIVSPMMECRDLKLSITGIDKLPAVLYGDSTRISQILTNLIGNAIKFTMSGEIVVSLSVLESKSSRINLEISVKDTGIGIHEKDIQNLFKPFSQIDASSTRNFSGAGLGLSISSKLAELMGGRISVKSSFGQGSVFSLVLPLKTGVGDRAIEMSGPKNYNNENEGLETGKGLVLVVEDNIVNSMVASRLLLKSGFEVIKAFNGQEAVDCYRSHPVDLIIMDWHMPVMDGIDATRQIRSLSGGDLVPIIGLTANALDEHQELCIEAGMNDVLTKPIDRALMTSKIRYWLDKRRN